MPRIDTLPNIPNHVQENMSYRASMVKGGRSCSVEIGDSEDGSDFFPQKKIKMFNNQSNFSLRLVDNSATPTLKIRGQQIIFTSDNGKEAQMYETDTGYEFSVHLPTKPASPVIDFTIRHKNVAFYKQPEVTQEEADDLGVNISDIDRPDNIVGSYACYITTRITGDPSDIQHGKCFHIFRPWAEDANGVRVWCELNIDPVLNKLTVEMPADFHDNAVYPVLIDPTFGYDPGSGGTQVTWSGKNTAHFETAYHHTASSGDTVTMLSAYCRKTSASAATLNIGVLDMGVTNNADGATRIVQTDLTVPSTSLSWVDSGALSTGLTASNNYVVAQGGQSGASIRMVYDATGGPQMYQSSFTGDLEATFNADLSNLSYKFFMYATYTAGGGSYTLTTDSGSYSYSGTSADLAASIILALDTASYSYSGTAADLTFAPAGAFDLVTDSGSYSYSGTANQLIVDRVLTTDSGSYSYSGTDVTLTFASVGSFTLVTESGSYTYSGTANQLIADRVLTTDTASYAYSGTSLDMERGYNLVTDTASYTYSGTSMLFDLDAVLEAETVSYSYNGSDLGLTLTGLLTIGQLRSYSHDKAIRVNSQDRSIEVR